MGSNTGRMLPAVVVLCLLSAAPHAAAAITCGQVASAIQVCTAYIRGMAPLSPPCCGAVRSLSEMARTPADRQAACNCLRSFTGKVPGVKPALAAAIPAKCGVVVGFPIATTTDCSKVH